MKEGPFLFKEQIFLKVGSTFLIQDELVEGPDIISQNQAQL